jgi:hypothetical protein
MAETTEWVDEKYDRVYRQELTGLERRRANDPACTVDDIAGTLKNLYIFDGNNWDGRSEVYQTEINATIAAYEHFIAEWKKEIEHEKVI